MTSSLGPLETQLLAYAQSRKGQTITAGEFVTAFGWTADAGTQSPEPPGAARASSSGSGPAFTWRLRASPPAAAGVPGNSWHSPP